MESFPQPSMLFSANVNPMFVYLVIRPKSDIRIMELLLITTFTSSSLLFIFYEPQLLRHYSMYSASICIGAVFLHPSQFAFQAYIDIFLFKNFSNKFYFVPHIIS